MTKGSAVKRAAAPAAGSWRPQAARVEALVPANIEQAADLGAGYVIIKLRDVAVVRRKSGAARAAELPIMSRERLVTALNRGGTLTGEKPRARPADNEGKNTGFGKNRALRQRVLQCRTAFDPKRTIPRALKLTHALRPHRA